MTETIIHVSVPAQRLGYLRDGCGTMTPRDAAALQRLCNVVEDWATKTPARILLHSSRRSMMRTTYKESGQPWLSFELSSSISNVAKIKSER